MDLVAKGLTSVPLTDSGMGTVGVTYHDPQRTPVHLVLTSSPTQAVCVCVCVCVEGWGTLELRKCPCTLYLTHTLKLTGSGPVGPDG